ncbi:MAG: PQQ-binding-like beta-propeller repeat protein [Pseudomonadota bacterium]
MASLSAATGLIWTKGLKYGGLGLGGIVLAGDRLFVSTGDEIQILSQDGEVLNEYQDTGGTPNSPLTADQAGNVYFVADVAVRSLDNDGNLRWTSRPFPPPKHLDPGVPDLTQVPLILSNISGAVFGARGDTTYSVDMANGDVKWSLPQSGAGVPIAGAGRTLFLESNVGTRVFDTSTKEVLGKLDAGDGRKVRFSSPYARAGSGAGFGVLGYVCVANTGFVSLDPCGKRRWSFKDQDVQFASLIGAEELLISLAFGFDRVANVRSATDKLMAYNSEGARVAGPVETSPFVGASNLAQEMPIFAGADGTTYTIYCDGVAEKALFQAFGVDFRESWRVDLGAGCPRGTGVLSARGVVYLTRESFGLAEVIAIQTTSPGLARSSWPTLRHDNQGTSWLQ